ncbi:MAG: tRNA (uridine(54)-C5)-methyltransferase TrmA [Rheinheimera sp.]|nr:tRNA (uridine(54)-C5)-methyltransferase TrmA [Rheinheimera sp.]
MQPGQVYPTQYAQLLADKANDVRQLFSAFAMPQPQVFASAPQHYRCRAEFRVWHEGDDLYHIMFDPQTKTRHRIDYFPVAIKTIADFMPRLIEAIKRRPLLRNRLYQIDYLSGLSGELLVSLIYKKPVPPEWADEIRQLKAELLTDHPLDFIGRARKQKILIDRDFITEQLQIENRQLSYQQVENSFSQPNAAVNQQMLGWACQISKQLGGDLLELYCGNGNFSLALAPYFRQVVATELSKVSIKSAELNIRQNQINNVQVLAMSAEDVSAALAQGNALKQLDLTGLALNTILVDPPRAGLDPATVQLVSRFDDILYISCNPATLADNLRTLTQTHDVIQFAFFDQFPYTHHMESGVWLRRKTA